MSLLPKDRWCKQKLTQTDILDLQRNICQKQVIVLHIMHQISQMIRPTSQFLAQNKEFIAAEKIDPYLKTTRTSNPRRNVTPTFVPSGSTTVVPNPTDTALAQEPTQAPQVGETTPAGGQSNTVALVAAVLLLLLAAAGILLAVYLYKKRMTEGNNQV